MRRRNSLPRQFFRRARGYIDLPAPDAPPSDDGGAEDAPPKKKKGAKSKEAPAKPAAAKGAKGAKSAKSKTPDVESERGARAKHVEQVGRDDRILDLLSLDAAGHVAAPERPGAQRVETARLRPQILEIRLRERKFG